MKRHILGLMDWFNSVNGLLQSSLLVGYYTKAISWIVQRPQLSILLPGCVVFILSYPTLFTLYTTPNMIYLAPIADFKSIVVSPVTSGIDDIIFKQLTMQSSKGPVLSDKPFLINCLNAQNQLLEGMDKSQFVLFSVFNFWNNSVELLADDEHYLKTIQRNIRDRNQIISSPSQIFGGITRLNGVLTSVDFLKLSICFNSTNNITDIWDSNLQQINSSTQVFYREKPSRSYQKLKLVLTWMSTGERLELLCLKVITVIYISISLLNVYGVRSKLGILVAFAAEMVLSLLSSTTITFYLFQQTDFLQIPVEILTFAVTIVSIENMFRALSVVSKSKEKITLPLKFARTVSRANIVSSGIIFLNLVILGLIVPFVPTTTKHFCAFAAIALIINHFLHLTFFMAVLFIDLRRQGYSAHANSTNDTIPNFKRKTETGSYIFSFILGINEDLSNQPTRSSIRHSLGQFILKIKLPFTSALSSALIMLSILIPLNASWITSGFSFNIFKIFAVLSDSPNVISSVPSNIIKSSSVGSLVSSDQEYPFKFFFEKKSFGLIIGRLISSGKFFNFSNSGKPTSLQVLVEEPAFSLDKLPPNFQNGTFKISQLVKTDFEMTYLFDMYYILEFFTCLAFVLATSTIVLKYYEQDCFLPFQDSMEKQEDMLDECSSFNSIDLINGHSLDVVKIDTSKNSPFIVSIGMDHNVMVWSPTIKPLPKPFQLPIDRYDWPVAHSVLSLGGSFVALFSKKGHIKCWSRLKKCWLWSIEIANLKNVIPLESFFRRKSDLTKPERSNKPMRKVSNASFRSNLSQLANSFDHPPEDKELYEKAELVFVVPSGQIYVIDLESASVYGTIVSHERLISASLLVSPRVNDRLVCSTDLGKLIVATVVNNKWRVRTIFIQEGRYNRGKGLMTPLAMKNSHLRTSKLDRQNSSSSLTNMIVPLNIPLEEFVNSAIVTVQFVGMILRTYGVVAELLDVQTGTLVKRFHIGQFKKGTLQVFHDQPTHCRFCGCATVSSFSIVYTELDSNTLIMHTFSIDNRAKNNICLRVERDPRETRCLGFDSVTEHQHWLDNVEVWNLTDLNMVIGVKRKEVSEVQTSGLRNRKAYKGTPHIADVWEGFTMNGKGKVTYHDILNGENEGLLVKRLRGNACFGHKSIVVSFGNIMKILYLGNENLILNVEEDAMKRNGLSFINRPRKRKG